MPNLTSVGGLTPVGYEIVLQAIDAIKNLQELTASVTDFDTKVAMTANTVEKAAEKWGMSWQSALAILKQVDKETAGMNLSVLEKKLGGNEGRPLFLHDISDALNDLQSKMKAGVFTAEEMEVIQEKIASGSSLFGKLGTQAYGDVARKLKEAEQNANGFSRGINVINIAMGTLVAQGIFLITNALSNAFREAIQQARDYELALYNISNAERVMSMEGIDITPKDFGETIKKIKNNFPIFSEQEIATGVANIGLFSKELGLTKDQVDHLAQSIAILAVENHKTFGETESQVLTALLSGTTKGLRDLYLEVDDDAVKQRALAMGIKTTNGELDAHTKKMIELQLIFENTDKLIPLMGEYLESNTAKLATLKSSWEDFSKRLGLIFTPLLAAMGDFVSKSLQGWIKLIDHLSEPISSFVASVITDLEMVGKAIEQLAQNKKIDIKGLIEFRVQEYTKNLANVKKGFDDIGSSLEDNKTAIPTVKKELIDLSNVDLDSLVDSVKSFADRMDELNRKFQQNNLRDLQDFDKKLTRTQEDYQLDVQRTIEDFNNRRHQLEQQYRDNEKNAEARFQEQLRELREKYLFDLEDALRQRDARQVIRLMEQYKMDKDNLTARFNLEQNERKKQYRQELADLKRQEAQKLAEMAQAEKIKEQRMIEDFNTERARKLEDYLQQKSDLEKSWDEKLQLEAQKLAEQFNLNESQTKAIYELLRKYYGPGGFINGLYDYSYQSLVGRSQNLLSALQTLIAQFISLSNSTNTLLSGGGSPPPKYKAKGGIDIVNSPTTTSYGAVYGEAGAEAHIFLPLGKFIPSIQNLASSLPSLDGEKMSIELLLSPDLEARIIGNTMGRTADVIMRTIRSK